MGNHEVYTDIKIVPIAGLIHNEKNPRYIKSKKHRDLMKSLKEFPEMKLLREIIIDENNVILAGDKRVYALEELGYAEVTVKQVFNLTEAQKDEFIVKDNIHNGEWDTDIIANHFDAEKLIEWGVPDFNITGESKNDKEEKPSKPQEVTCPNCHHPFELSESRR